VEGRLNFIDILERVTGKKVERHSVSVIHDDKTPIEELRWFARFTRFVTRRPIKLEPPGPKIEILTTNDIDPDTGRVYPDYKERRAARKARESKFKDIGDCYPDD
jgi:hypothetical protein